ncbi:MAG: phosphatidylglycerophosphatase [Candidatus Dependentiae bacterium]|nr:phosphatidylglycerophosphatase [Candidatus Dependentiae bacterium]
MNRALIAARIASCGGLGYSRYMPGTVASVIAMLVHYVMRGVLCQYTMITIGVVLTVLGMWATIISLVSPHDDPSWIVIDEWCAVWFLCCVMPYTAVWYGIGCIIFRILDIAKTWPVSLMERFPSAWGVFLDDFMAAFLTAIFLCCVVIPAIL